jgi:hypothetical protein
MRPPDLGRPDRESERPAPRDRSRVAAGTSLSARLVLSAPTPYCLQAGGMQQAIPADLDATVAGHLFNWPTDQRRYPKRTSDTPPTWSAEAPTL